MSFQAQNGGEKRDFGAPLLALNGISKTFPGVKALDNVSFDVVSGEVHMLLGENGAGKSTLMKVLCGTTTADSGTFHYKGERVRIGSPADARTFGIAVIFQEFTLVPYLDIAQNIFLGREFAGRIPGTIDKKKIYAEAQRVLDGIGFQIDPRTPVHDLGIAQQQMVEIAKALSQDAKILVMDEPTAALSDRETDLLFAMIRKLKQQGVAIVYISHRLAEVFALGDRITVLRDGRKIESMRPQDTSPEALVNLMAGRSVDTSYARHFHEPGDVALEVKALSAENGIEDISLGVRRGEIVGLCGLVGSGRSEVARAIFGADKVTAGEVRLFGEKAEGAPQDSLKRGLALIPENRKQQGLALNRSVTDNIVLAALKRLFPSHLFQPRRAETVAATMVNKLKIATPTPRRLAGTLSGGNQQKTVIGKWLTAEARCFIFDEPTRGIDVGAKAEIFKVMDELAASGAAILLISSEQSEIVRVCDRAYVMRDKRIAGHLKRDELSEANILKLGMHHG